MTLIAGEVKFKLSSGATVGPYSAEHEDSDNYVDVRKPSPKPNVGGSETEWSSWTYFNHGQWLTDRFTKLS